MIAKNIVFSEHNQELIKPILPGLPISVFYTTFREDTYNYINWHWHEAFQYCLITEGTVDFVFPHQTYHVSKGNGIFINTQQAHLCKGATSDPCAYLCLDIPPSFLASDNWSRIYLKYIKPVIDNPTPPVLLFYKQNPEHQQLLHSLQQIQELLKKESQFMELDIQINIIEIWKTTFRYLAQSNTPKTPDYQDNNRLKRILEYMMKHYSEKITLEDIADHLSVSRSECCRFFKKATGQSMFSYLTTLRLNSSMELLKNTNMSISEIADAVGFCSQSYYTSCFQKENHITPKKYRELSLRKPNDVLSHDISSR